MGCRNGGLAYELQRDLRSAGGWRSRCFRYGGRGTRSERLPAAFDQATGKEAWRFWTVPKPGEKGSETWKGKGIENGGAPTWFTGTYDPELDTISTGRRAIRGRITTETNAAATISIPIA